MRCGVFLKSISCFLLGALIPASVPAQVARPATRPPSSQTKATPPPFQPQDLAGKSLAELRWLRNEIYARHGRPFKAYDLHCHFMGKGWYKPDPNYTDARLSPAETEEITRIAAREKEMSTQNIIEAGGQRRINPANVVNPDQLPALTAAEKEKIAVNGCLVLPTDQDQLFYLYENNDYHGIPSFITTDAVLQLFHVFFDYALRNVEQKKLLPALLGLSRALRDSFHQAAGTLPAGPLQTAAARNEAFFEVACAFQEDREPLPGRGESAKAAAEWRLCRAHAGWAESPLLGKRVDYSLFVPRGHYTRTAELSRYFMAMNWFGCMGVDVDDDVRLLQGLLMARALRGPGPGGRTRLDDWRRIDAVCSLFAGPSDDPGPLDFLEIHDPVYGPTAADQDLTDPVKLKTARERIAALFARKTKIVGMGAWGTQKPQFRFLGQRYSRDAEIFQRLTIHDEKLKLFREFPAGLDILAVLGSSRAKELLLGDLKPSWALWPGYPAALDAMARECAVKTDADWSSDLARGWLWCLQALADERARGKSTQFFTSTAGWDLKNLNTALASWAELRHDTILLTKQSGGAECGGDPHQKKVWIPEPPRGYVEPAAEFYRRLGLLIARLQTRLGEENAMEPPFAELLKRFSDVSTFLKTVSEKELSGKSLVLAEFEQIQKFGSLLENMTLLAMLDGESYLSWTDLEDGPDRKIALIADVHTWNQEALEVGVGKAQAIWVIVENAGLLYLTRGAVFSYYEFLHPAADRLTDEAWQKLLETGQAPPPPAWSTPLRSPRPEPEMPPPSYVSPTGIPPWSTEPGWKMIEYDTGC